MPLLPLHIITLIYAAFIPKYALIPGLRGIAKNDTLRVAARQNK
jgi:hypothetical protein